MPVIEGIDAGMQWLLTSAFVVAVAVFSAWSHVRGKVAPKPKATEFALAGQLADMGPVRELVEQTGLLVQQQIRTNLALEAAAAALKAAADAYAGQLAAIQSEHEIEAEVQRRFERELDRERRARRRTAAPRKRATPPSS